MMELAPGWKMELDRGPDWLFVRLHLDGPSDDGTTGLAEAIWEVMQKQFSHRIVIEFDHVPRVRSTLIGEMVLLHKRIHSTGGLLRICGISDACYESLRAARLHDRFPRYTDRTAAVMGHRPNKPR